MNDIQGDGVFFGERFEALPGERGVVGVAVGGGVAAAGDQREDRRGVPAPAERAIENRLAGLGREQVDHLIEQHRGVPGRGVIHRRVIHHPVGVTLTAGVCPATPPTSAAATAWRNATPL